MKNFYDIYVLCEDRSLSSFEKFKSAFLIGAKNSDEYYFPYLTDDSEFFTNELSIILEKLFTEKEEEYGIYWHADIEDYITSPMMFFTNDGYVIYGLRVHEDKAEKVLETLKKMFSSEVGKIVFEQPPPLNSKEFARSFNDKIDW